MSWGCESARSVCPQGFLLCPGRAAVGPAVCRGRTGAAGCPAAARAVSGAEGLDGQLTAYFAACRLDAESFSTGWVK